MYHRKRTRSITADKYSPYRRLLLLYCVFPLACIVLSIILFLSVLWMRIDTFPLDSTQGTRPDSAFNADKEIWLVVGTDDRKFASDDITELGPDSDNPGRRADIMFLMSPQEDGLSILGIQRDIEVTYKNTTDRLNFMLLASEQRLADAFCHDLHVPIDHMITIDINGFVSLVDAAGGINVTVENETRDVLSGLHLKAGDNHLNGRQALQYVRSRHPQKFINGQWQEESEFDGSLSRVASSGDVLGHVANTFTTSWNPVKQAHMMWAISDAVSISEGTTLNDLRRLVGKSLTIENLHVEPIGQGLRTRANVASIDQLADAGYIGLCEVDIDDSNFPTAEEFESRREESPF